MDASELTNTLIERAKVAGKSEAEINAALAEWWVRHKVYFLKSISWDKYQAPIYIDRRTMVNVLNKACMLWWDDQMVPTKKYLYTITIYLSLKDDKRNIFNFD